MNTIRLNHAIMCAIALSVLPFFTTSAALAQPATQPTDGPEVWKLTIRPQAAAQPALQYALRPSVADQTPGNAASNYLLAFARTEQIGFTHIDPNDFKSKVLPPAKPKLEGDEDDDPLTYQDILSYYTEKLSLEQLPANDTGEFVNSFRTPLQMLDTAAKRDYCRWDLPLREQGYELLLPHLNPARELGDVGVLRARLQLKKGDFPDCIASLRSVFQMSHDLAHEGGIVQSLVAAGNARLAAKELSEVIQQPGAPNLYWPLANLPRPFVDQRSSMEWERAAFFATFPQLNRVESESFSAADWNELVNRLTHLSSFMSDDHGVLRPSAETLSAAATGMALYPVAKRSLIERGMKADEVDVMPVPQVLGRYVVNEYRRWFDDMSKFAGLPYWQSRSRLLRAQNDLAQAASGPFSRTLLSPIPKVTLHAKQLARLDRHLAALQTVEAIRAYAAAHDGKLPADLDELDAGELPSALDPTTGTRFTYRADGDHATLESISPAGVPQREGFRIELTLTK